MIRKILLVTDGSAGFEKSDQFALDLAKALGSEIAVMCHFEAPSGFRRRAAAMFQEHRDALQREVNDAIQEVAQRIQAAGVPVSCLAIEGSLAEAVLRATDEVKADLIVLGAGPKLGLPGVLLGGIADVVRHASVPVVVVK